MSAGTQEPLFPLSHPFSSFFMDTKHKLVYRTEKFSQQEFGSAQNKFPNLAFINKV
jgi:hypothetical protein